MTFTIPYSFSPGTKAVAQEVNSNFDACRNAILQNETNILQNESDITSLQTADANNIKIDGSVVSSNPQSYKKTVITDASNETPIVITSSNHGRSTGDVVAISDVLGNTAANGNWTITKIDDDTFSLDDSSGNGTYTSGGNVYLLPKLKENLTNKKYVDDITGQLTTGIKEHGFLASYASITSLNISSGAVWDGTNQEPIIDNTGFTLNLANNGANGLDTGSMAASTGYFIFICKGDSGVCSLASTSPTSPTLPSGYDSYKKLVGWWETDASSNFTDNLIYYDLGGGIKQVDWKFATPTAGVADFAGTTTATPTNVTLSVPIGLKVKPNLLVQCIRALGATCDTQILDKNSNTYVRLRTVSADDFNSTTVTSIRTDANGQIQMLSASGMQATVVVYTLGFLLDGGMF